MAAVVLKQSNPGYISRLGCGIDAFDKELDSLRMYWNSLPIQGSVFFRTVTPKGGTYKESGFDNVLQLPVIDSDSKRVPFVTPMKGFPKSFTTTEYRLGVQAERRTTETELLPYAKRAMSGLMDSWRRLLEYSFADVWNNLTSTDAAYVGADGVAVASASHPHRIRDTGVWSNIQAAGALTHARFSTARTAMRKRQDHFGYVTPISARKIVVSSTDEEAARRIVNSELVSGGSLNDKNVFMGSVDIMVYDYQTSTTQWALWGDVNTAEYGGLIFGNEIPAVIRPATGQDTGTDIIWGEVLRGVFMTGAMIEPNLELNAGA